MSSDRANPPSDRDQKGNLGLSLQHEIQLLLRVWTPVTEGEIRSGSTLVYLNKGDVALLWEFREGSKQENSLTLA